MRKVLAVVMVALLVAGQPAAAQTIAPAGGVSDWQRYPCTSAGFDIKSLTASDSSGQEPGLTTVKVSGAVGCAVSTPGPTYALAVFRHGEALGSINLRTGSLPYESIPSPFKMIGGVLAGRPVAICVNSDVDVRMACLLITAVGPGVVTATPLAPSDPLVTRPVIVATTQGNPSCGTCWTAIRPT